MLLCPTLAHLPQLAAASSLTQTMNGASPVEETRTSPGTGFRSRSSGPTCPRRTQQGAGRGSPQPRLATLAAFCFFVILPFSPRKTRLAGKRPSRHLVGNVPVEAPQLGPRRRVGRRLTDTVCEGTSPAGGGCSTSLLLCGHRSASPVNPPQLLPPRTGNSQMKPSK